MCCSYSYDALRQVGYHEMNHAPDSSCSNLQQMCVFASTAGQSVGWLVGCLVTNTEFIVRLRSREEFTQCDKSGPKRGEVSCFSNSDISETLSGLLSEATVWAEVQCIFPARILAKKLNSILNSTL